jgi:methenyltetrahydromethanopterin cyclohydrolase
MSVTLTLNEQAWAIADRLVDAAANLRIQVHTIGGARVLDCGVTADGGLQAGLGLARVCLADMAEVTLGSGEAAGMPCPVVQVATDAPVLACMASQYAGWKVSVGKFFAMGSGPMRAAYAKEELFQEIPGSEQPAMVVGVLESKELPNEEVIAYLAKELDLPADSITLLVAPASTIAGTVQVVARSVETALHKLHTLKFDLASVVTGFGSAPLPPVASKEIEAIGRTNDAILYGGRAVLWVWGDDAQLAELGPKVPSSASPDFGAPFAEIFTRYNQDFYKIDPQLFSPAQVVFNNLKSGRCHVFGKLEPEVLKKSFGL